MMGDLKRLMSDHTFSEAETIQINNYPFVVISHSGVGLDGLNYKYKTYFTANTLGYTMYYVADEVEVVGSLKCFLLTNDERIVKNSSIEKVGVFFT